MSEFSATEKLRAILDELGIEWELPEDRYYEDRITYWRVSNINWVAHESADNELWLNCDSITGLTPEQAIAATVGNRTDLTKRLREVTGLHAFAELFGFDWTDDSDWTWHDVARTMADAIDAATVGAETCEQEEHGWSTEGDHARVWLTCGHDCMVETVADLPRFCPECGRRVMSE